MSWVDKFKLKALRSPMAWSLTHVAVTGVTPFCTDHWSATWAVDALYRLATALRRASARLTPGMLETSWVRRGAPMPPALHPTSPSPQGRCRCGSQDAIAPGLRLGGSLQRLLEHLFLVEVADADRADLTLPLKELEATPRVKTLLLELRPALVGEVCEVLARKMNENEVKVVDTNLLEILINYLFNRLIVANRTFDLCGQEKLLARNSGGSDSLTCVWLCFVEERHVDVSPTQAQPLLNSALHSAPLVRHRHSAEGEHGH
eukprot:CAMPEP_0180769924 /NCGR_PEP_ID=MMETSP1038_2-20121128/41364_1 /TAXON_ID=632150 /ORGANISM="Azadinium spinosum, Strain 3D9" /LENGTH=260 /DNA_ID=CAMNT_0022804687 /DNA_START=58 /DNA_END=842 /DNA_ORIENTATION=-